MLDIKFVRENTEIVKENIKKKFQDEKISLVDEVIEIDKKWRELKRKVDELRSKRNSISKEVSEMKKEGKDFSDLVSEAKKILSEIDEIEKEEDRLLKERDEILAKLPNIISERTPIGKDDSENVVIETYGEPKKFDFEPKGHVELMEKKGWGDFDSSARVSGNGFYYIQGDLALLNQALIQFAIDKMISKGFFYVETPLMLRGKVIDNVTDIHDRENMIYKIENEDLYLIGTSEHSLIGRYVDRVIEKKSLPIKQTSYSMCFRKEIGSHGIDEKGLFRTHQFNKVEMVVICHPEDSEKFYEEMKSITVEIFRELELPVRVLSICSGDLGDLKKEQVDIEVFSPRKQEYFEVGSCSNLTDAQARRLNIRVGVGKERFYPHTLNNTVIATGRALVAILENHQDSEGNVLIPKALQKYFPKNKI